MTSIGDGAAASWLGSAYSSINSSSGDWISAAAGGGSSGGTLSNAIGQGSAFANLLASTMQNQITGMGNIAAQQAVLRMQEEQQTKLDQAQSDLNDAQNTISSSSASTGQLTTDSSTTIDLSSNIMTLRDGTTVDITTGLRVDPVTHLPYSPSYSLTSTPNATTSTTTTTTT
jgi:hypothetical protein